jgi:hypothetical protein
MGMNIQLEIIKAARSNGNPDIQRFAKTYLDLPLSEKRNINQFIERISSIQNCGVIGALEVVGKVGEYLSGGN